MSTPEHYAVTIVEPGGARVTVPCDDREEAASIAACMRPSCGASYIHDHGRELVFKAPRLSGQALRPPCARPRRLSQAQIEASAKRFDTDGEHENAANMRELLT